MRRKFINRRGFTLPELIVTCVIIGVLSSLGAYSYWMHMTAARDASRRIDVEQIGTHLASEKLQTGKLPMPAAPFTMVNSGTSNVAAFQGVFNGQVAINGYAKIPADPISGRYYGYSVTKNRQWFQLATVVEDESPWRARLFGNYKPVARNVLPSLFLAHSAPGGGVVEIALGSVTGGSQGSLNRKTFVLDGGSANLPYDAKGKPVANSSLSFEQLLTQKGVTPFGTLRFRSCFEIKEAGAYAGPGEYQIIGTDGSAQTDNCQGDVGGPAIAIWSTSGWAACSATCGGGTRTRTVSCVLDGIGTSDGNCAPAGTKPADSESCNMQDCG